MTCTKYTILYIWDCIRKRIQPIRDKDLFNPSLHALAHTNQVLVNVMPPLTIWLIA